MRPNPGSTGATIVARILRCLPGESQLRLLSNIKLSQPGVAKAVATSLLELQVEEPEKVTAPTGPFPVPSADSPTLVSRTDGAIIRRPARRLSPQQVQELYGSAPTTEDGGSGARRRG